MIPLNQWQFQPRSPVSRTSCISTYSILYQPKHN